MFSNRSQQCCYRSSIFVLVACYVVVINSAASATVTTTTQSALQASEETAPEQMNVNTRNAESNLFSMCPNMLHNIFENSVPHDEAKAGKFEEYIPAPLKAGEENMDDEMYLHSCLQACCEKGRNNTCNIVFVFKRKCFHVQCRSNEACLPKQHDPKKDRLQLILVNPVQVQGTDEEKVTWQDLLKASKGDSESAPWEELISNNVNPLSFWKQPRKYHFAPRHQDNSPYDDDDDFPIAEKRVKQMLLSQAAGGGEALMPEEMAYYNSNMPQEAQPSMPRYIPCNFELPDLGNRCPLKEECMPIHGSSITGICKCISGFVRNQRRECVPQEMDYPLLEEASARDGHNLMAVSASEPLPAIETVKDDEQQEESLDTTSVKAETNKNIVVSVASKEVRLPEKEVTLAVYTVPEEETSKYKYLWTLISQPKGPMNGTISDQSNSKVKLSNLSEGLYTFKVSVTGDNGTYGEAMANVSVLPEKRINRVPQVIITPSEQTIRQPTTNAVLDGSTSTDDDKIIGWHWEVVSGPIGYQPKLPEVNTLQLTDLTAPGNYTFKLTVTDSDNVTNSTNANITVLKGTDYPPVANAGDAVILYLPNNNITLNGTASSDDHEIVAWEWTKDANDEAKAVDMQNTRTPYVQLSNLEEGMYTFVLKVTDGSGQSSAAKVHVFVKPQTNSPPIAEAGGNMTANLPRNWVVLNGSLSTDDIRIQSYKWLQLSGPNKAVILNANDSIANATSLTLGLYQFELLVTDENNNTSNDTMWVKITQEKNAPPVANAGGDQSVILPVSALYFNGSSSWDDLAVVNYTWTRDDTSLAAGVIVGDSDKKPVLILTNLVHGRYVFKLTVTDEQGLTSADTVSVIVHPDPMLLNLIELTLPMGISILTQAELNSITQKIGLLLNDMKILMRDIKYNTKTGAAILVFYVERDQGHPVDGHTVEILLKEKLQRDASILGTVFTDVRTTVCQNKCSGHGICNAATRACICEAFWMPSMSYFWDIDEANCDWSILYVFVTVIVSFLLLSGLFWSIACTCRRQARSATSKPRSRPKVQKYSLIGTQDEEAPHFSRTTSLTDSETDSDILFETRTKPNGILRSNGAGSSVGSRNKHNHGQQSKYASTKLSRKIKT